MRDQRLVEHGEPGDRLEILYRVVAVAKAAQPMSPIAASRRCFIMSPSRVSQRAFYCPTRVYFPNKGSAIQSAVNGRNCS
jgi:hypothetical protein